MAIAEVQRDVVYEVIKSIENEAGGDSRFFVLVIFAKKIKMKYLLFTGSLFLSILVNSQVVVKPLLVDPGTSNCDAKVLVTGLNIPGNTELIKRHYDGGTPTHTPVTFGDTLTGICTGFIDPQVYDEFVLVSTTSMYDSICFSNVVLPDFDFQVTGYTMPSGPLAFDGEIALTFNSAYTLVYFNAVGEAGQALISTGDNQTFHFANLGTGLLSIAYNHPISGLQFATTLTITSTGVEVNDLLLVDYQYQDATNGCNGSIEFLPVGTGPYTVEWENGSISNDLLYDTLCPGNYFVLVTDQANMDNQLVEFSIVNTSQVFIDSSVVYFSPDDTLTLFFTECGIDYTEPLDSINYSEVYIDDSNYVITILLYQGSAVITYVDSFHYIDDTTITLIDLSIFCDYFKSTQGFKGKRALFVRYPGGGIANILELPESSNLKVYPVPADQYLIIGAANSEGVILSPTGEVVASFRNGQANVSQLSEGIYLVRTSEGGLARIVVKH